MPNTMGQGILLVSTLAGLALFIPLFLVFAARTYLIVLTYSCTGEDRFRWPRDPFLDWVVPSIPVLAAAFIWTTLGFILVMPLGLFLPWEAVLVGGGLIAYLAAPVSLNCMLAAPSKLLFLFPPVIGRMLRQFAGLAFASLVPLPLFVVTLVGVIFLMRRAPWAVVVVSLALPPALLLHARAWGRFMWLALNYDRPRPSKKKRRRPQPEAVTESSPEPGSEPEMAIQAIHPAPLAEEGSYDLREEAATETAKTNLTEYYTRQREYERRLRERSGHPNPDQIALPEPPTYATAMGQKVFPFLAYDDTLTAYLALFLATLAPAVLILNFLQLWFG